MNRELEFTAIYSQLNTRIRIKKIQYCTLILEINNFIVPNNITTQNSRSTGDITYADLGPNPFAGDAHLRTLTCLSDDDRVQYEEIQLQHEADTGVPVCGPQTILGDHA